MAKLSGKSVQIQRKCFQSFIPNFLVVELYTVVKILDNFEIIN